MVRPLRTSDVSGKRNTRTGVRIRNAKIKERGFRITRRQLFLITILLLLFMGSGIGYVWSSFEGTQIGYDLSRLKQEELRLKELNRKLRVELATYLSPQYLEEATQRSGLREALPEQIRVLPCR
ncbi:MAG: hypothetical protein JRH13_02855 [Deltaproteobacteria bacterium]|nr:hypothetical protein [Deltaproteobacteria bacterium]MBW2016703.1 hypothetical protein [Deltaproteobacteria bacterium]MBW2128287.1 hypothetical protein [Deltaproteobacteria bacterium]MBW2302468.1 hypothetical protein [Deltaproteobacteria bacterium]